MYVKLTCRAISEEGVKGMKVLQSSYAGMSVPIVDDSPMTRGDLVRVGPAGLLKTDGNSAQRITLYTSRDGQTMQCEETLCFQTLLKVFC